MSAPTPDQIVRFLQAKHVHGSCPRCSAHDWAINSTPSPIAGSLLASAEGGYSLEQGKVASFVLLWCNNCGFMSPHALWLIDKWLKENGEAGSGLYD